MAHDGDTGSTQTLRHTDTLAQEDEAAADADPGATAGYGRLIPVPIDGFRGNGPVVIKGDMWIGRGKQNDVVIGKQRISSRHTSLRRRGLGAVYITDHSTNGTSVNGERLKKGTETLLSGGDEIDIAGAAKYIFQPPKPQGGSDDPPSAGADAAAAASSKMDDSMAETMTCGICQEILYKCVSAVPCLHNFCSACASDCLKRSSECPMCRTEISEVRRNHDLSKLVDAFLDAHPERRRSVEEMAEMDARSTITTESLRVSKKRPAPDGGAHGRYDDSDDYGDDFSGSSSDEGVGYQPNARPRAALVPTHVRCPNCVISADEPFPPGIFVCPPTPGPGPFGLFSSLVGMPSDNNHVSCTMCRCLLPKRNAPPVPTRCQFCAKTLCDAYKRSSACVPPAASVPGCAAGPAGRLRPLRQHDIAYPLRSAALQHNAHETKILQDYLTSKTISPEALHQTLMERLESGQFTLSVVPAPTDQMAGAMTNFPWHASTVNNDPTAAAVVVPAGEATSVADAHCCGECWRKILAQLIYQFRAAIPNTCVAFLACCLPGVCPDGTIPVQCVATSYWQ